MRVSNLSTKNNMLYEMKRNYSDLKTTEKQLGSGKRFQKVSEDPIRSITSLYSRIRLNQIDQYSKNLGNGEDRIRITSDKLSSVTDILKKAREIAIQGANVTYTSQDRANMALEVEELLKEVIDQANTQFEQGYIFSGSKVDVQPFEIVYGNDIFGIQKVEKVNYQGDAYPHITDISLEEQVETSLTGNHVFWAETHTVVSLTDGANYIARQDQEILIDGYRVGIRAGDSLDVVVETINLNVPSVTAFKRELPTGETVLGLESNYPHQMTFLDIEGGSVLTDLGILKPGAEGREVFNNISANTLESQSSVFDTLIRLRNSLMEDSLENLSGNDLAGIDNAISNVLSSQAKISSVVNRITYNRHDLEMERENITVRLSKSEDMDMAEAAINLSEINNIHQLSLRTAARYIRPTLLEFL